MAKKSLAVVSDDALLSLWEIRIVTELVIRVRAEDEEDARRKTLGQRLWVHETPETRRFTDCIAWGPSEIEVGLVI